MAMQCYMVIGMLWPFDHAYEAHKLLQTSGEVFAPLFLGVGTLMVMKIYSEIIGYVFNNMETLNMMMIFMKKYLFPLYWWCCGS